NLGEDERCQRRLLPCGGGHLLHGGRLPCPPWLGRLYHDLGDGLLRHDHLCDAPLPLLLLQPQPGWRHCAHTATDESAKMQRTLGSAANFVTRQPSNLCSTALPPAVRWVACVTGLAVTTLRCCNCDVLT